MQTAMRSHDFIRMENGFGAMNYRPLDVVLTRGQGIWVWDVDGNQLVREVRGRGLMIGVELLEEAGGARRFCESLMARGLLCKETHKNVIRLATPLIIRKEEIDWAVERVAAVLESG